MSAPRPAEPPKEDWAKFVELENAFFDLCFQMGVKFNLTMRFPDGLRVTKRSAR